MVKETEARQSDAGEPQDDRLTFTQKLVVKQVLPYRGETIVVPGKSNPAIPDEVWMMLQQSGDLAAQHLLNLLSHKRFPNMAVKDQARMIELALSRAYGSPDGAVRKNVHVHIADDDKAFNAMTELSKKAHRDLPEFNKNKVASPIEGRFKVVSPNEDGDN